ncbi:MAG: hypothetical protein HAW67_01515 [Endozoicomonadaceae bacterium]|nr:hypothetical protein [Endozoicomonadaceae bacterium]
MPLEKVQNKCCGQCLFSKNKIVSDERKAEILKICKENNNHFQCHKATIKGVEGTCRAFYDKYTNPSLSAFLESIGEVEFVDIK